MKADTNITLASCPVTFDEVSHAYFMADGQRLSGITSLIHAATGLGTYPEATDYVRNVCIPRAGEYGHAVHHAILYLEDLGLRQTEFPGEFGNWEVSAELDNYLRNRQGFAPLANEYTVSDLQRYASQIDNVWVKEDTNEIWLVDTKTNNLGYYPGGKNALKQYLSWQLSIYARLFEVQNPTLKVAGLACNWLRRDQAEFWTIDRIDDADVDAMLSTPWVYDNGKFSYIIPQSDVFAPTISADPEAPIVQFPADLASELASIDSFIASLQARADIIKAELRQAMETAGAKSWDCGVFRATLSAPTTSTTLDTKRLKAEQPDIYNIYAKSSTRAGSLRITYPEL